MVTKVIRLVGFITFLSITLTAVFYIAGFVLTPSDKRSSLTAAISPKDDPRKIRADVQIVPVNPTYQYYVNKVAVKLSHSAAMIARQAQTSKSGNETIDTTLSKYESVAFKQAAIPTKFSNANDELFDWYVVYLDKEDKLIDTSESPDQKASITSKKLPKSKSANSQSDILQWKMTNMLEELNKTDNVIVAERIYKPIPLYEPNDSLLHSNGLWNPNPTNQDAWWLHKINPYGAWDIIKVGQVPNDTDPIVVAVLDSGVNYTHPDLRDQIWQNKNEIPSNNIDDDQNGYIDDTMGWDFHNNDPDIMDDYGHGTRCAGILAAQGDNDESNNPKEGRSALGTVWNRVKIMPLRIYGTAPISPMGSYCNIDPAICAMIYAADMGAKVTSNSYAAWGWALMRDAVRYGHSKGMISVFAAGNEGRYHPNHSDAGLTVGRTSYDDTVMTLSDYGEDIDVVAPGNNIITTCIQPGSMLGYYCLGGGTSSATPQVAGLAALLILNKPSVSIEEVRQLIRMGAQDVGQPGRDLRAGSGRIDISRTLELQNTNPSIFTPFIISPKGLSPINSRTPIIGSVAYGQIDVPHTYNRYILEYAKTMENTQWHTIQESTVAVQNDILGYLDPTNLEEDIKYMVRLRVIDEAGIEYSHLVGNVIADRIITEVSLDDSLRMDENYQIYGSISYHTPSILRDYKITYRRNNNPNGIWTDAGIVLENGGQRPVSKGILARINGGELSVENRQAYEFLLQVTDSNGVIYRKPLQIISFYKDPSPPCPVIEGIESTSRNDGKYDVSIKLSPADSQYMGKYYFFQRCIRDTGDKQCEIPMVASMMSNPYFLGSNMNVIYNQQPYIDTNLDRGYEKGNIIVYEINHGSVNQSNNPDPRASCSEVSYTIE